MKSSAEVLSGLRRRRQQLLLVLAFLTMSFCEASNAPLPVRAQPETATSSSLTAQQARAYAELLKLRPGPARTALRSEPAHSAGALLVADCIEFTELMLSQEQSRYTTTIAAQDQRLTLLEKLPERGPLAEYARAEIRLHQAGAQVAFGHEVQGAWSLRQAYQQMQATVRRYPTYLPARKTLGMMQFFIGSLPEGYRWFLKLLGLAGSVDTGLRNLRAAARQPSDFQTEAQIIVALIEETYYKKQPEALQLATHLTRQQPDNLLFSYLLVSLNKKQHRTDAALTAYRARPAGTGYFPLPYLHHMAADLLLYQGQYAASRRENELFLAGFRGAHYRKDAYFKLYLAAWLGNDAAAAERYRQQIDAGGRTVVEEDTYAQRFFDDHQPLSRPLTRARLQIDGGYYQEALGTLSGFRATAGTSLRDRLEAPYRRARAWQGLGRADSARLFYARTIALAGVAPYYFAPQSALQLGYLYQAEGQRAKAKAYFEKALRYDKHEYKNSTDTKAKLALKELE